MNRKKLYGLLLGALFSSLPYRSELAAYDRSGRTSSIEECLCEDGTLGQRIACLDKHVRILTHFNQHMPEYLQEELYMLIGGFDETLFKHELVALCIKKMKYVRTLAPIHETWHVFLQTYADVEKDQFVKDFAILIFCIYASMLAELENDHFVTGRVTLVDVFVLYGKVSLIPIRELLNLLDLCYVRFEFLLKEYGMFSSLTWSEWFGKYWWVPPVVIVSLIYNVFYQQYVESQSFGSAYLFE